MKKFIEAYREFKELQQTFGPGYLFVWSKLGRCYFSIYSTKEKLQKEKAFELIC